MLCHGRATEPLMVDHQDSTFRGSRDVNIIGAKARCGYNHKVLTSIHKLRVYPFRCPHPKRMSALKGGRNGLGIRRIDNLHVGTGCAQQVVTDALDRFLETVPGLEDLACRAKRP